MTPIRFTKMHGAGNDYVYVNCFDEPIPADPAEVARRISDRNFGVGGDGMILICPSDVADARMRMFNADGSEAEMCGNGIRCVAKYVYDHRIAAKTQMTIETGAGVLALDLEIVDGLTERVKVDMGEPILEMARIPIAIAGKDANEKVVNADMASCMSLAGPDGWAEACGLDPRMTGVSMGNPHVTIYCDRVADVPLEVVGPLLETEAVFPNRINLHFVEVHSSDEVTMRTWERGSGITLACGTGASAVCVAGLLAGRTGRRLLAHLPGGDLELWWNEADGHVYMTGPATEVFSGVWPSAAALVSEPDGDRRACTSITDRI